MSHREVAAKIAAQLVKPLEEYLDRVGGDAAGSGVEYQIRFEIADDGLRARARFHAGPYHADDVLLESDGTEVKLRVPTDQYGRTPVESTLPALPPLSTRTRPRPTPRAEVPPPPPMPDLDEVPPPPPAPDPAEALRALGYPEKRIEPTLWYLQVMKRDPQVFVRVASEKGQDLHQLSGEMLYHAQDLKAQLDAAEAKAREESS